MTLSTYANRFQHIWTPTRPYAADEYTAGIYPRSRRKALQCRHIQGNNPAQINLLTIDVDSPTGVLDVLEDNRRLPPHWVTENGSNGHVHATWALSGPVTVSPNGRPRPRAYLESVAEGLRRRFNGDEAYTGFLFKNPLSDYWTHYHSKSTPLWTLDGLSSALEYERCMPSPGWKTSARKDKALPGLSRNCDLFDALAKIARREARAYGRRNAVDEFTVFVHETAHHLNTEMPFSSPLGAVEVDGIARSVARWVVEQSRAWKGVHEESWLTKQRVRSQAGNAVKSAQRSERIAMARSHYRSSGGSMTRRELAEAVGMSVDWVKKNMAEIRS